MTFIIKILNIKIYVTGITETEEQEIISIFKVQEIISADSVVGRRIVKYPLR